ncbi:hypothetical protein P4479_21740 [Brevibacillus agri]|uniref:hypothetical protein n=1 Tax=Brevibacillus agri TaxID=51101 RepID=UPI002E23F223|nr:hypothetical protein [Brevibacillus agri]
MKAHLKKIGIFAVALGLLVVPNLETANAAISVTTEAKLSVSKISNGKYSVSGLNKTTFTEGEYDALLKVQVYQSGVYLVNRQDTFQYSPANLGQTTTTYDFLNDIECYAFAAVNGKVDEDDAVYKFLD